MVWRNREWIDWWCGGIEWIDWWCGGIESGLNGGVEE